MSMTTLATVDSRKGAHTTLADGTVLFWHAGTLSECGEPTCPERHVTKAELFAPDPEADAARAFEAGWDAAKGER